MEYSPGMFWLKIRVLKQSLLHLLLRPSCLLPSGVCW